MRDCAVIVLGGDPIPVEALDEIPDRSWVVAADSGLDHALAIGLEVDLLVGDLDSVSPAALEAVSAVPRQVFPRDKDATDFELALAAVLTDEDLDRIIVLGGHGGRIDHLLSNAGVLTDPRLSHLHLEWIAGRTKIQVVHHTGRIHGHAGETVSLVALTDTVEGVTTTGLRWELQEATLHRWSSRSMSNIQLKPVATVSISGGVLAVVQPTAWT
jgi:thiamine pyrophosphokinase